MSVCNPCIKTKTLPNCLSQLVIGTIALISQSVKVYIQDIATGALMVLDGTSDGDGLVTVEFEDSKYFFENHPYELWITDIGADIGAFETITFDGASSNTVCMRFHSVKGEDGDIVAYLTQTIAEA